MPTINQLIKHGRERRTEKSKTPIMAQCPQKRGVCLSVSTTSPQKPNSALRKIARVRRTNKQDGTVYIPGEAPSSSAAAVCATCPACVTTSSAARWTRRASPRESRPVPSTAQSALSKRSARGRARRGAHKRDLLVGICLIYK